MRGNLEQRKDQAHPRRVSKPLDNENPSQQPSIDAILSFTTATKDLRITEVLG
jgi:hypothetical protein